VTDTGVVVVDAQRLLSEARKVVAEARATGMPLVGVLLTHPHTDHYGGLSEVLAAAPPPRELPTLMVTRVAGQLRPELGKVAADPKD
jgi:glyoxylase-like metal-dependent hydrolase (beta-lactamase superfamily II)